VCKISEDIAFPLRHHPQPSTCFFSIAKPPKLFLPVFQTYGCAVCSYFLKAVGRS
jgi:hypothetical protein